jgi:hypothetical protein
MLNVIALHPAAKTQTEDEAVKSPPEQKRSHVLTQLKQEKSGRLDCNNELDFEIPALEIYAAR